VRRLLPLLPLALFLALPATAGSRVVLDRAEPAWHLVKPARPAHLIAHVRPGSLVALRTRPFGRVVARVGAVTRFGSERALGVVSKRQGRWLAVTEAGVSGNRAVWVDARSGGLRYSSTRLEVDVDLSQRTLTLRRGGAVLQRIAVGIGAAGSPTPTGRFAVTDKLSGPRFSASYGCCILALSAIQPNLPRGWSGGNRVAIHGTLSASDFGRAVSAGCVHAPDTTLRYLMRVVPLGTPVVIRP
jgi:hypothetical protein